MKTQIFLNKTGVKIRAIKETETSNWQTEDGFGFSSEKSLRIFMKENGFFTLLEVMGTKSKCFK